jgi:acetyl esterase/lipase
MSDKHAAVKSKLAEIGARFNPDVLVATQSLYADLVAPPSDDVTVDTDVSYGADERQRLDIYRAKDGVKRPVLFFVPGGGFVGGDKRGSDRFYGNLGRWFVKHGFVAVAINYRLAPANAWPSGAEDVGRALAWTISNISQYGGDAGNILIFGQSAGATHVATFLFHPALAAPKPGVVGVVLASGFYRVTEDNRAPNIAAYFGSDASKFEDRSPLTHVGAETIPLLLTVAEFDPGVLAAPTFQLADAITQKTGKAPRVLWLKGHNHVSTVLSFDSGDDAFGREILDFAADLSPK